MPLGRLRRRGCASGSGTGGGVAGKALCDAYVVAKRADPFLSYRRFASHVVLSGRSNRNR